MTEMKTLGGAVFKCSPRTAREAEERMLLGALASCSSSVQQIVPGTPLFLLVGDQLLGGFEAASEGRNNIDSNAFASVPVHITDPSSSTTSSSSSSFSVNGSPSRLPAQVRLRRVRACVALTKLDLDRVLLKQKAQHDDEDDKEGQVIILSEDQVRRLTAQLFGSSGETNTRSRRSLSKTSSECDKEKRSPLSVGSEDSWLSAEEGSESDSHGQHDFKQPQQRHASVSMTALDATPDISSDVESSAGSCWSGGSTRECESMETMDTVDSICGVEEDREGSGRKKDLSIVVEDEDSNAISYVNIVNAAVDKFLDSVNNSMNVRQPNDTEYDLTKYSGNDANLIWWRVQQIVSQIYGTASVQIYGSFATGLWLPGQSDLDLLISFQRLVFPTLPPQQQQQQRMFASGSGLEAPASGTPANSPSDSPPLQPFHMGMSMQSMMPAPVAMHPMSPHPAQSHSQTSSQSSRGPSVEQEAGEMATEGHTQHKNEVRNGSEPNVARSATAGNEESPTRTESNPNLSTTPPPMNPGMPMMFAPMMHILPSVEVVDIDRKQMLVYLYALHSALKVQPWCKSIKLIRSSSMPVIKMIAVNTIEPGMHGPEIPVDISFRTSDHYGIQARDYVLQLTEDLPNVLRPLVLVLKRLLREYNLNDVYKGGLGSYSLISMVAFYLLRCGFVIGSARDARRPGHLGVASTTSTGTSPCHALNVDAATSPTRNGIPISPGPRSIRSQSVPTLGSALNFPSPPISPVTLAPTPPPMMPSNAMHSAAQQHTASAGPAFQQQQQQPPSSVSVSSSSGASVASTPSPSITPEPITMPPGQPPLHHPAAQRSFKRPVPVLDPDNVPPLLSRDQLEGLGEAERARMERAAQVIDEATKEARQWLKRYKEKQVQGKLEIGVLLVGFLQLYASPAAGGLDLSQVGLSLEGRGKLFIPSQPAALCIRDPVVSTNCLGASSFQMNVVQQKFGELRDRVMIQPAALFPLLAMSQEVPFSSKDNAPAQSHEATQSSHLPPLPPGVPPPMSPMFPNGPYAVQGYMYPFMTPMMSFPMHLVSPVGMFPGSSPFPFPPNSMGQQQQRMPQMVPAFFQHPHGPQSHQHHQNRKYHHGRQNRASTAYEGSRNNGAADTVQSRSPAHREDRPSTPKARGSRSSKSRRNRSHHSTSN